MAIFQREIPKCKRCYRYVKGGIGKTFCPKCGGELAVYTYWYISYYHNGRKIVKAVGRNANKAQAIKMERAIRTAIDNDEYKPKKKSKVLFSEFAQLWLEKYSKVDNRESTYEGNKIVIKTLNKCFGNRRLSDIDEADIQRFKNLKRQSKKKNGTPISNATINRHLSCLRRILNVARKKEKLIDKNVFENVEFLKEDGEGARPLQMDEEIRLFEAAKRNTDYLYSLILMARTTGMRRGEILGLKWEDVILYESPRIISSPLSSQPIIEDYGKIIVGAKYAKGWKKREIPICKVLAEELKKTKIEERKGYVFHNKKSDRFGNIRKAFETAVKIAGLGRYQFHGLRKTFGTRLLQDGVNLVKIQRLLGHSNITTTMRYLGVDEKELIGAMSGVGAYLADNLGKTGVKKVQLTKSEKPQFA